MPETPVLDVWNIIQALHCWKQVMFFLTRPFRIHAARTENENVGRRSLMFCTPSLRGRKQGIFGACFHLCQSILSSSSGAACEHVSWLWIKRLEKAEPAWRSPSHHSCRFHSFSPNTRHKWECGCLCKGLCGTECVFPFPFFFLLLPKITQKKRRIITALLIISLHNYKHDFDSVSVIGWARQ